MAEYPSRDPGVAQQGDQQALGRRLGAIRRRGDQPPGRRRPAPPHVAAERPVQGREAHVLLERAVEERRAVGQRDRRLQRGERFVGHPQLVELDTVVPVQVPALDPDAGLWAGFDGDEDPAGQFGVVMPGVLSLFGLLLAS